MPQLAVLPPADPADVFRRAWRLYEKFITHNWMRHREVYDAVRQIADGYGGSLSVADFGCGDGCCTLRALAGLPLTRYIAVDRLRPLLDAIPARLPRGVAAELIEGDLATVVADPPEQPVDLLLAAYSLHHLPTEEKREFLRRARRWMAPQGRLVIVDLLRRADEEHMEACDVPETLATMQELCMAAGWRSPRLVYRDPEEFFAVLTSRPRSAAGRASSLTSFTDQRQT
jgi:trans-aconitate methyltransferase